MSIIGRLDGELERMARTFTIEALAKDFQPVILDALSRHKKAKQRKSVLTPVLTVWLILALTLRRDLAYPNVLAWLVSGLRRIGARLPRRLVKDGAISHARRRIGVDVLRDLFRWTGRRGLELGADFHGWISVIVDGSQLTMPDTAANCFRWGKPGASRGMAAFAQLRLVALVSAATQAVLEVVLAPCRGEGTGEKTLAVDLVGKTARGGLLFLLDRGFWVFGILDAILERQAAFLLRIPSNARLKPIRGTRLPDGSYLAWFEERGGERRHKVRVIRYQIRGFKHGRLVTSIVDPSISALQLALHYHRRWEVELAYDALKTHQCARRTGQCPTVLRSKTPDLVEQEVYAMLTAYNLTRSLMCQAAEKHRLDPLALSFVDTLRVILEAIPTLRAARSERLPALYERLLDDIASCVLERRRRPRVCRRAVKVKMSAFPLKRWNDHEIRRSMSDDLRVLGARE